MSDYGYGASLDSVLWFSANQVFSGMDPYDSFGSPGMGSRDFGDFGYSPYSPGYY